MKNDEYSEFKSEEKIHDDLKPEKVKISFNFVALSSTIVATIVIVLMIIIATKI